MKHIPNILTMLNLFCGALAVVSVLFLHVEEALILQGISLTADLLDGMLARKLKVAGPLGIQLDSLADVISFGMVPGAVIYMTLVQSLNIDPAVGTWSERFALLPALLIPVFAGLRLARFNISTNQSDHFIGLPTPAMSMFFTGWLLIILGGNLNFIEYLEEPVYIYGFIIIFSYMMNSKWIHFKLKFNKGSLSNPLIIWLLGAVVGLVAFYPYFALSASVLLYIILSLVSNFVNIKI